MTRKLVQGIVSDRSRRVIHVVRVLDDILDLPEIHEIIDRMCARVLARHGGTYNTCPGAPRYGIRV